METPPGGKYSMCKSLYTRSFSPEEANLYGQLAIGTLEQEIKLLKIQLLRLLEAQREWDESKVRLMAAIQAEDGTIRTPAEIYQTLTLDGYEIKKVEGIDARGQPIDSTEKHVKLRKSGFESKIHSTLLLIGKLEAQHKELLKQDIPDSERIMQIARDLRSFTQAADKTVPEQD